MKYLCKTQVCLLTSLLLCLSWGCELNSPQETKAQQDIEKLRSTLGLDSACVFREYNSDIPGIKALFYIVDDKKDTFQYAVTDKDSIFLWAITYTDGIHMIRDLE